MKVDLPTCNSKCEVFVERQETPLLLSITENLENTSTTVDQPPDDSQTIIRDIQIENERLRMEIHQVMTLKDNGKLEVEELTHRISVLEARVFTIDRFESDKDVTFYTGFPNRVVFESVFEFLDPGNKGENIPYLFSYKRAIFRQTSLNMRQFKAVEEVSAYSRVFFIKKISQQNKTVTNEHVFTYKPSLIEKQGTLILLD